MFCMAFSDRLFGLVFCLAAYFAVPFTDLRVTRTRLFGSFWNSAKGAVHPAALPGTNVGEPEEGVDYKPFRQKPSAQAK